MKLKLKWLADFNTKEPITGNSESAEEPLFGCIDHMPVTKLSELLSIDKEVLTAKVRSAKYLPQAILGVEIPKEEGKIRLLGIPTLNDRLLQQAVVQVITARFEYEVLDSTQTKTCNKQF